MASADVIVFALRWGAVPATVSQLPPLGGRVVIDAMNRIGPDPMRSTSEDLAELLPGARVVKAFNTIGFENLATARGRRTPAAMFVAGDDEGAKQVALDLAAELGFRAEDAGPLLNARALEGMVKVWLALAERHGRGIAFAIWRADPGAATLRRAGICVVRPLADPPGSPVRSSRATSIVRLKAAAKRAVHGGHHD